MTHPVVDSHVHFWDPALLDYPWLHEHPVLLRPFTAPDLAAAMAEGMGDRVARRVVFVEANAAPGQALREASLAGANAVVAGIVAHGGLDEPATLGRRLDDLAARPRVKGIRHNIQGMPPGFCLSPAFVDGVREVGRRGLCFDLCATHEQLDEVTELCVRCPATRLVLDHCGKPSLGGGWPTRWAAAIARLASLEHVHCKLSGLLTQAPPGRRRPEELLPFARHVVECFGAARVMYGSDWPVLTLAGEYGDWYRFTRSLTRDWPAAEARAFYHDNAVAFYRL